MTHSPPVPPGNQSPYPLQSAPHEAPSGTPIDAPAARLGQHDEPIVGTAALGIGLAIGLGSAALLAAWFFSGGEKPKPKPKPTPRKPRAKAAATGTPSKTSRAGTSTARATPTRRRKTTNDNH